MYTQLEVLRRRRFRYTHALSDFATRQSFYAPEHYGLPVARRKLVKGVLQPAKLIFCNHAAIRRWRVELDTQAFKVRHSLDRNDAFSASHIDQQIPSGCENKGLGGLWDFAFGRFADANVNFLPEILEVALIAPVVT